MELRHLQYFLAVVDHGSVSAGAESLHLTQPGLSRQLRQLEGELGVDLFDRRGGRLHLSPAGTALLPLVRELVDKVGDLRLAAGLQADGQVRAITIGAPTVTLTDVVAPFIATLGEQDPRADVIDADGQTPAEVLRAGADLAIGTSTAVGPYGSLSLAVLPVWAYVHGDHAWAHRTSVAIEELATSAVIGLPPAFTAREALDAAFASAGLSHATLLEASNGTVAQALAAARRGVAVVSDDPRFDLVQLAVTTADPNRPLSVRLVATWRNDRPTAPTLSHIAERLGTFVRERYQVPAA